MMLNEQQNNQQPDCIDDFVFTDLEALAAEVEAENQAEADTENQEGAGTASAPSDTGDAKSYDWQVTYDMACSCGRAGLSVIPVTCDGTKRPGCKWTEFQTKRANKAQVHAWFHCHIQPDSVFNTSKPAYRALGVVTGQVSLNLTVIDFDNEAYWFKFTELLPNKPELQTIVDACPLVKTPRPGRHLYVRCAEPVPKNQKLAMDVTNTKCYIETRGEGGFVVAPGGSTAVHPTGRPYELISGSFDRIPVITTERLEALFDLCRSLSEATQQPSEQPMQQQERKGAGQYDTPQAGTASAPSTADGMKPGDDFNERGDVLDVLQRHGWTVTNRLANGDIELRRPGKSDDGHSATYHEAGSRKLSVWSSNAYPFEANKHYSPFDVFAVLEHRSDYKEAAKALAKAGYGTKSSSRSGTKKENAGTSSPSADEPLPSTFTKPMMQCLQAIYAYTPASFNDKDAVGFEVMCNLDTLPLDKAAVQLYNANQLLTDCERLFLMAQLKTRRIDSELVSSIVQIGAPKEPAVSYSLDDLLRLQLPEPQFLPLLGEQGDTTKVFVKGLSHIVTAKPGHGKTHTVAQSAMYWNKQPVLYLSEEPTSIWKYRIQSYLNAGLPNNPNLIIRPALGEGHTYVMEQIKEATKGTIIVVDTLRAFSGVQKEEDATEWTMALDPWLVEARKNDITLVMVHHSRKGKSSGDPVEDASGSNSAMSRVEQRIGITARADGSITIGGRGKNWVITSSNWRRNGDRFTRMTQEEIKKQADSLQTAIMEHMTATATITVSGLHKRLTDAGTSCSLGSVKTILNKMSDAGDAVNINAEQKGATGAWKLTANLINSTESEEKDNMT